MKVKLTVISGPSQGRKLKVDSPTTIAIGRASDNDFQLSGRAISRRHCKIHFDGSQLTIRDLDSKNGTIVNQKKISKRELSSGDTIKIGRSKLKIRFERDTSAQTSTKSDTDGSKVDKISEESITRVPKRDEAIDLSKFPQLQQRYKEVLNDLNTIYKIGNIINAEDSTERLYPTILETIFNVVEAKRGKIYICEDNDELKPVATKLESDTKYDFGISKTILQEAVNEGIAVLSYNAMTDDRFKVQQSVVINRIKSVMCVPIKSQEETLGAIYIDSQEEVGAFSERDLSLLTAIGNQAGIAIERAKLHSRINNFLLNTIKTMVASLEAKDVYTKGHSERVTAFSLSIGRELDLNQDRLRKLEIAAILHDIGKIGVPGEILHKQGDLTEEEFDKVKEHPCIGAEIVENIEGTEKIVTGIRHHHERWDGKGYPDGLQDEEIPLISRILSVADAYDAMTSNRPYRSKLSEKETIDELKRNKGAQFDPQIIDTFIKSKSKGEIKKFSTVINDLFGS